MRERCRKDGPCAVTRFMLEEPIIALRLFDLALMGKEAVDLSLLKAAEEMGVDLDEMNKKFKSHRRALRLKKIPEALEEGCVLTDWAPAELPNV